MNYHSLNNQGTDICVPVGCIIIIRPVNNLCYRIRPVFGKVSIYKQNQNSCVEKLGCKNKICNTAHLFTWSIFSNPFNHHNDKIFQEVVDNNNSERNALSEQIWYHHFVIVVWTNFGFVFFTIMSIFYFKYFVLIRWYLAFAEAFHCSIIVFFFVSLFICLIYTIRSNSFWLPSNFSFDPMILLFKTFTFHNRKFIGCLFTRTI